MELVFLHGVPASGKLTTARALEERVGYPVFHNHLVVDLLTGLFPFGSPAFVRLREQFWLAAFAEAAAADRSLVFTFTPDVTVQAGFSRRVQNAIEALGGRVRFVRLTVSEAEQKRRIAQPDRHQFHKVVDPAWLERRRGTSAPEQPPVDLEIDTDRSSPDASAARIVEQFRLRLQPRQERYPAW